MSTMAGAELDRAAAELLRGGAAVIEEHGWLAGSMGYPGRGFCLVGSMLFADGGEMAIRCGSTLSGSTAALLRACRAVLPPDWRIEACFPPDAHVNQAMRFNDRTHPGAGRLRAMMLAAADALDPPDPLAAELAALAAEPRRWSKWSVAAGLGGAVPPAEEVVAAEEPAAVA